MTTDIIGGGTKFGVRGKIPRKSKAEKKGLSEYLPGNCKFCPKIGAGAKPYCPPCSAAYDLNYDPAGRCYGDHPHFSSLIVLIPIKYKP